MESIRRTTNKHKGINSKDEQTKEKNIATGSQAGTYWFGRGSQLQMEAQYIFEYPAWDSLLYGVSADFLVRA